MSVPHEMWLSPKIEHRSSPAHGTGVFAVEPIDAGEPVEIWGETWEGRPVITYTSDADEAAAAAANGMLVMRFDTDLWSIEPPGTNPGYFINHSCDSNVWMDGAFTLSARRSIDVGEELTVDYALFEAELEDWGFDCRCGSAVCRGRIRGDDWRRPDVRARYGTHFIPLITKMMQSERSTI